MKLRPLRWYEHIREWCILHPQWYIVRQDGTVLDGYIERSTAEFSARVNYPGTMVVWLPDRHKKLPKAVQSGAPA